MNGSFGNIDMLEQRQKFTEITRTAKEIARGMIPVIFSALRIFLTSRGIEPKRLKDEH